MGRELTTEEFVEKVKKIHGDKYDYSKVRYKRSKEKVIIICSDHGEFKQRASTHLSGAGCIKCGLIYRSNNIRKDVEQFKIEANKVHNDKYNYSKVSYRNTDKNIIIICPTHGEFKQTPIRHLRGGGCFECLKDKLSIGRDEFIKRAKEKHNDKYDYSKVYYKNSKTRVRIICSKHGEFYQVSYAHLMGSGCPKCTNNHPMNQSDFIKKAERVHGDRYDYSNAKYRRHNEKVIIICNIHGNFKQDPSNHICGKGCPHCTLKSEGKVKELLVKYFKDWNITSNKKIWDRYKNYDHRRFCDFYMEKNGVKVIVEYDGRQHFMPVRFGGRSLKKAEKAFKHTQLKDSLDSQFCKANNVLLHRIRYDEDKEESIKELRNSL